jgi:16S rRNA (guanine527-N7)-methyltransferase
MNGLAADRQRALALRVVSRETIARLDIFVSLLLTWQSRINLISSNTSDQIWSRHILDSLQLIDLVDEWQDWVDIGSGAGFPGLIVAIAAAEQSNRKVWLVESNYKRCAFLREAARATGANVQIVNQKIESAADQLPPTPDIVSARAVAPLSQLFEMAYPLLKTGGVGLFPKGQDVESELTAAAKYWRFGAALTASITDSDGRIVAVSDLQPQPR